MIASLGDDVNLNRWPCLLEKPMVLLGYRVRSHGLSDLRGNWSRLVEWDYTHSRSRVRVVTKPAEALDPRRCPKGLQVWGRKLIIYGLKLQQRAPLYIALPGPLRWWKMAPIIMLMAYYIRFEFILFQSAVWPVVRVLSLSVSAVYFDNFLLWEWWPPWKH